MLALDDRGLEAKLGGADRGDITAGTRADHGEVELGLGHGGFLNEHGHRVFDEGLESGEKLCAEGTVDHAMIDRKRARSSWSRS